MLNRFIEIIAAAVAMLGLGFWWGKKHEAKDSYHDGLNRRRELDSMPDEELIRRVAQGEHEPGSNGAKKPK